MNAVDPRELGDRALLVYLLLGDLPRRGWPGRGRVIVRRILQLLGVAIAVVGVLVLARAVILVAWAASL